MPIFAWTSRQSETCRLKPTSRLRHRKGVAAPVGQLRLGSDEPLQELAVREDLESLEQVVVILRRQEDRPRFTFARKDESLQELVGAIRKIGEPGLPVAQGNGPPCS
jgi:hypothetical protein